GGNDLVEHAKMLTDEVIGDEVTDTIVKFRRPFEIREQKRQAGQLQALIDVERVGAIDVAEYLIGKQALGGEERLSLAEHVMKRTSGNPDRRQDAQFGLIFEHKPQWPRAHFGRYGRRLHLVEDHRQILTLARRLTFHVDKMRSMGDRLEYDQE